MLRLERKTSILWRMIAENVNHEGAKNMSKGQEKKKETKKKPAKTLMEKRAEKKAKKGK
jgi:hypothetical protein